MTSTAGEEVFVDVPDVGGRVSKDRREVSKTDSKYYLGQSTARSATLLEPIPPEHEITLTFNHVNSWVPNLNLGQPGGKKDVLSKMKDPEAAAPPSKRQILYNVSGAAKPGEVLALMGPSGSGKTSLISILGGRAASVISVEGDILFNGHKPGKSMKRKMGFVLQDDLLYPDLTVFETLYYAAQLRLPKSMSKEEKSERVAKVITALGIDKCQDTIIGGFMRRGVSGGERKRVSVGHELLINPSIIFLDEPTSGLDSTTALALVTTLHGLAQGGRTVVTTIHQPSSRMFQKIEKLMLLSEGRLLYYGLNSCCVDWFNALDAPCPFGINVADFILDLASANQGNSKEEGAEIRAVQVNSFNTWVEHPTWDAEAGVSSEIVPMAAEFKETVLSSPGGGKVMHAGKALSGGSIMGKLSSIASLSMRGHKDGEERAEMSDGKSWGTGWFSQFAILFSRAVKVRRFDSLSSQKFMQLGLVAFITGLFWFQRGGVNTLDSARDVSGLLFFESLFMSFQAMFGALFVFPNEMRMVMKERSSGMYRLSAYYLARTMSDLPMDCFYPTIFVIIAYFMGGLRLEAWAFFANLATVLLSLLVAQTLGLLLGAGVDNVKTAQTFATVFMLTIMLIGGYYVSVVPAWIAWVKYLSFIYYTYNMTLFIEFSGRDFVACPPAGGECVPVDDLQSALGLAKDPNLPIGFDAGMMLVLLFVGRVLVYFVLDRKTKQKRK
eukprot:CAMPEP_0177781214 /NCGR_PEP_ID=MMETSP0491_2-20121128/17710_1 /TAXON_ID=63592 /ORGANISM="Tetraselmis chuii, Strain PLY429" /LENGTH=721 /DNA_ID=CAMNT_0019301223 /DNA_START=294 /DNA_END=2459 /DNA_ORIENTATION=+